MNLAVSISDLAANREDCFDFLEKSRRSVDAALWPLHEQVGLIEQDVSLGCIANPCRHKVHASQSLDDGSPQVEREHGTLWPLVDVAILGERHDEEVAHRLGLFEVANVADVKNIEAAANENLLHATLGGSSFASARHSE